MRVFIVPNVTKEKALQAAREAAVILDDCGVETLVQTEFAQDFPPLSRLKFVSAPEAYGVCDVVLSVGGDGSLLHTARHIFDDPKPIIGVNTGRLGFLTILETDELDKLRLLAKGDYIVEYRSLIQGEIAPGRHVGTALNDIVLFKEKPEKTIAVDIYCDDILMSSFRGDGVVFSTPTGSTAYSMSAGGPIVDARMSAIIVTQICAHIVHMPPMVLAADRTVRVVSRGAENEHISIIADGVQREPFLPKEQLIISQSETTVPMIQFFDTDQLKSIDKKLKGR